MRRTALPALLLAAGSLAGCAPIGVRGGSPPGGAPNSAAGSATSGTGTAPAPVTTSNEVPTPAAAEHAAGAATPVSAVRAFATAYVNWTAATVTADLRALARASVGQARSAMELEAGETAQDGELQRGALANHGTVEAVAPERGSRTAYVVVTRESTSAAAGGAYSGLKPAWHVTVATVARQPSGRWVLSGWQPEG